MILSGMLLVIGTFIFILILGYVGGTHTLYTLIPLSIGLLLLMVGLAKRGAD